MDNALDYFFHLYVEKEPNQEVVDCSACGSSGYAISGDLNLIERLVMKSDARYIIVVEKVFVCLYSHSISRRNKNAI